MQSEENTQVPGTTDENYFYVHLMGHAKIHITEDNKLAVTLCDANWAARTTLKFANSSNSIELENMHLIAKFEDMDQAEVTGKLSAATHTFVELDPSSPKLARCMHTTDPPCNMVVDINP